MENFLQQLDPYKWTVFSAIVLFIVYWGLSTFLHKRQAANKLSSLIRQATLISFILVGLLLVFLTIPFEDKDLRGQILTLVSALLSAAIALNSATFFGNAFAGMMIRAGNRYKPGEFIRVQNYFGLITEMSLFYVEIQRDDGGFTALPNLFLAVNPVEVTRKKPVISTTISLGYDEPRQKIQPLLIRSAKKAGLKSPYVLIKELGDFSIVYSIQGTLDESKDENKKKDSPIFVAQSILNGQILDILHKAGIEIVSPNFMNQRIATDKIFKPDKSTIVDLRQAEGPSQEEVYDKGSLVKTLQDKKDQLAALQKDQSSEEEIEAIKQSKIDMLNKDISEIEEGINKVDKDPD